MDASQLDYRIPRQRMVREQLAARGITDKTVLQAMAAVPRHLFVPDALRPTAYDDRPLPIGYGQTISQPLVVAAMCQLLAARPGMSVLEIGTGSGYQAAVLQAMGLTVFSVERLRPLYQEARERLSRMGLHTLRTLLSDGTLGWPEMAPFDRVIVAAGGPGIPQSLVDQLEDPGIMVIPVGGQRQAQHLIRVTKRSGGIQTTDCGPVTFVDLVGHQGWEQN